MSIERIGPALVVFCELSTNLQAEWTHLSCNVSDRSRRDLCHPMKASVTRPRGFGLLLDGAGRCKYMLVCLEQVVSNIHWHTSLVNAQKREGGCGSSHSTGPQDRTCTLGKQISAIGLQVQPSHRCATSPLSYNFFKWLLENCNITYSGFFQSSPAGQSNAPVHSWWNPRLILTFRDRGGFRDCPRGTIQSRTALFKLFVLSDLALEAPFWTWNYYVSM